MDLVSSRKPGLAKTTIHKWTPPLISCSLVPCLSFSPPVCLPVGLGLDHRLDLIRDFYHVKALVWGGAPETRGAELAGRARFRPIFQGSWVGGRRCSAGGLRILREAEIASNPCRSTEGRVAGDSCPSPSVASSSEGTRESFRRTCAAASFVFR
ncbi:hypothetical protein LX36DRAFT_661418 [Colletotrichum falcatum]|nr:hypothetical protein LX36DRAFT_661418 [Colletotrichum falcatum]